MIDLSLMVNINYLKSIYWFTAIEISDLTSIETTFISKLANIEMACWFNIVYFRIILRCIEGLSHPIVNSISYDNSRQRVAEVLRAEQKACLHSIQYEFECNWIDHNFKYNVILKIVILASHHRHHLQTGCFHQVHQWAVCCSECTWLAPH